MNNQRFFDNNKINRQELIEGLKFFYFLRETYNYLLKKQGNSENKFILGFLQVVKNCYDWQAYKINGYRQSLEDYIFWKSSKFYLKAIKKFLACELTKSEFINLMLDRIIYDRNRVLVLSQDFKKQSIIKLSSNHSQFGKIVSDLEFVLQTFNEEPNNYDVDYLTESDLRDVIKRALTEVEKYFTD